MDLDRYVDGLRGHLAAAASAGSEEARAIAERLSDALDAAARLMLLEALSDAASEITSELVPGSVDVRLRGRDPEFVVSRPPSADFADSTPASPVVEAPVTGPEPLDDTVSSRTTLRLPDQLKARVEQAAATDGLSVNSWLVRAVAAALEPRSRRAAQRGNRTGDSFTGWVR